MIEDAQSAATAASQNAESDSFQGTLYQDAFRRNDFTYGVSFLQQGYLQQASESFLEVIAAKPDDPDAYYNLGTLSLKKNDFSAAQTYLERALKLRADFKHGTTSA